jgi:hypothetical protein
MDEHLDIIEKSLYEYYICIQDQDPKGVIGRGHTETWADEAKKVEDAVKYLQENK